MFRLISEVKKEFDNIHKGVDYLKKILVPIGGSIPNKTIKIKNEKGEETEEYYKWQFIYSLIYSGMYSKDNIGVEVSFPKGNPSSNPIKLDGAIFDTPDWVNYYNEFWNDKKQDALNALRKSLIAVIEIKKDNGRNIEKYFNQQLKPAMKESESDFVIGFYYDTGRVWIFQKKGNIITRYDESYNQKGSRDEIKDLTLFLPDKYINIPSFSDIINKRDKLATVNRQNRKIDDLEVISGLNTDQLNGALSNILRTLTEVSLFNQEGYRLIIQCLAMKIYDEKYNKPLNFYITQQEKNYKSLYDHHIQVFIERIKGIYNNARTEYPAILGRFNIEWNNLSYISSLVSIVDNFQDYSFTKSYKTDLYQLVFYRFANEFAKSKQGQFITPIWLIDFLVKIVNPRSNESVIDPCVGIADFLSLSFVNSNPSLSDKNLYGIDNDDQMIMLAQLNMLLNGDGNAKLFHIPKYGSIESKIDIENNIKNLVPTYHKGGEWENPLRWLDNKEIKKFDVVLTNPPFGQDRAFRPKTSHDKEIAECYWLWELCGKQNGWIDPGLIFLENAVRLLKTNGRMGIVLSNSIASIDRWVDARKWLIDQVRIVALFDLPQNVFADTGVNTTLIVAYKPSKGELEKLKNNNYEIFVKDIQRVGYEVRTSKRIKKYVPIWKINEITFQVEVDENGEPLLDEEFTDTICQFRNWALGQEETLKKLFLN